jgi:hypothetical protein
MLGWLRYECGGQADEMKELELRLECEQDKWQVEESVERAGFG